MLTPGKYPMEEDYAQTKNDMRNLYSFVNSPAGTQNVNSVGNDNQTLEDLKIQALEIARQAADMETYLTYADMVAAQPKPKGSYAQVTNDPDSANNGYWVSDGAQWIWSGVQPASKSSVDAIRNDLDEKLGASDDRHLAVFADGASKVYALFDKDANLLLAGLDKPVQEEITSLRLVRDISSTDLLVFADDDGHVFGRIDKDANFYLAGLDDSVQRKLKSHPVETARGRDDAAYACAAPISEVIANRQAFQPSAFAPMPLDYARRKKSIPVTVLGQFSVTQPTERIVAPTPYSDDDRVVHPCAIEFYNDFRGYRYWLGLTPITVVENENPVVYGTHDWETIGMLDGFPQPLAEHPTAPGDGAGYKTYNSDIFFSYDPFSGELICGWRPSIEHPTHGNQYGVCIKRTRDGVNWTDQEFIFPMQAEKTIAAPALLYNAESGVWMLYSVEANDGIYVRTSPTLQNPTWTAPVKIPHPASILPWHIDVRYVSNKIMLLIHDYGLAKNFYFGMSDDGISFTISDVPLLTGDFDRPYKGTFLPVFLNNRLAFRLIWTTNQSGSWTLYSATTNFINLE